MQKGRKKERQRKKENKGKKIYSNCVSLFIFKYRKLKKTRK